MLERPSAYRARSSPWRLPGCLSFNPPPLVFPPFMGLEMNRRRPGQACVAAICVGLRTAVAPACFCQICGEGTPWLWNKRLFHFEPLRITAVLFGSCESVMVRKEGPLHASCSFAGAASRARSLCPALPRARARALSLSALMLGQHPPAV